MVAAARRTRGTPHERRNELLRPSPHLGYAEDRIGAHLMKCEAYQPAERFFRLAVWLNPYEPHFRLHLAHSLVEQRQFADAAKILREILDDQPGFEPARGLLLRCERQMPKP